MRLFFVVGECIPIRQPCQAIRPLGCGCRPWWILDPGVECQRRHAGTPRHGRQRERSLAKTQRRKGLLTMRHRSWLYRRNPAASEPQRHKDTNSDRPSPCFVPLCLRGEAGHAVRGRPALAGRHSKCAAQIRPHQSASVPGRWLAVDFSGFG